MTMEGAEDDLQGSTDMQPQTWWDENYIQLNEGIQSPNSSWTYLGSPSGSLSNDSVASYTRVNNRLARCSPGADPNDLLSSGSPFSIISLNNAMALQETFSARETAHANLDPYMVNERSSNREVVPSVQDGGVAYTQVCDFGSTLQPLNETPRLSSSQSYNAIVEGDPWSCMNPWPQYSAHGQRFNYMQESVPSPQILVESVNLQTAISQDVATSYSQQTVGNGYPAENVVTSNASNIRCPITLGFAPSTLPPGGGFSGLADVSLYPYLEGPLTACVNEDPWHPLGLPDCDVQVPANFHGGHALKNDRSPAKRLRKAPIVIAPRPLYKPQATFPDKPKGQGSRRRGSLGISKRAEILQIRERGACWVCALQKDPCGPERTCKRCALREQRGQANLLGCVRTQLQEMTTTFLPVSMTKMHQRDEIITYIQDRLTGWTHSEDNLGIEVYLTTGFGPPFRWILHEFNPAWPEVLSRYQHRTNDGGKTWYRTTTSSPPLGLKRLDKTDKEFLNKHIKDMIANHLDDFRRACFNGEDSFKARLTSLLCTLYANLPPRSSDNGLRDDLGGILEMLATTLIMGHTIDIERTHRAHVLSQLSGQKDPDAYPEEVSPWIASMQLKYFFSAIRMDLFHRNLSRLQQVLHQQGRKVARIRGLVFVLAFGLVLEECQHMLLLQAEGRVARWEEAEWTAYKTAKEKCFSIDEGFEFIGKIFHCRYSTGKNKQRADLNDWIMNSHGSTEKKFLASLHALFTSERDYLRGRKDLILASEQKGNYSSRLLARFLLDVM